MAKQKKSTDEGVTVDAAQKIMNEIDNVEALEAFAGEEAASQDGREGVKDAFSARKSELEQVKVGRDKFESLAEKVAKRVDEVKALHANHAKFDAVDEDLFTASDKLNELADAENDEVEIEFDTLQGILNAIAQKADRDASQRGMMQPSADQQSLIDAHQKLSELDF